MHLSKTGVRIISRLRQQLINKSNHVSVEAQESKNKTVLKSEFMSYRHAIMRT